MFWLALAAAAAIAPVVRWWFLSRSRARSASGLTRVVAVSGNGPTASVARAVAVALSTGGHNVGVATLEAGLQWYDPVSGSVATDPRRPSTLAELVALAAQLAGPTVSELVVDAGPLDFSSSASVRGGGPASDLVVLLELGARASDRSVLIDALCPHRGVLITTESSPDRLAELSAAAARRGSLVVVAEPPAAGSGEAALAGVVARAAAEVLNRHGAKPSRPVVLPLPPLPVPRPGEPAGRVPSGWSPPEARRA